MKKRARIICGPTASGKSDYALKIASQCKGQIINCDSLQLYQGLPVLTAQPSFEDCQKVPHYLYEIVSPGDKYSIGKYLEAVESHFKENDQKEAVFVGGTGFYIKALVEGLAKIPDVSQEVIQEVEARYDLIGEKEFRVELLKCDPEAGLKILENDRARSVRAMSVFIETGKPLSSFYGGDHKEILSDYEFEVIVLMSERASLYQKINERFEKMIEKGAIEEVKALLESGYDRSAPVMRAIGACEIVDYLEGSLSFEDMIERGQTLTRQYAKRQVTWFRHQISKLNSKRVISVTFLS